MQLTPETMLGFARRTVEKSIEKDRDILVAYLTGSLLSERDPLLGGSTDIDLVFIHSAKPETAWEIQRVTDDVHLDIKHHQQKAYIKPRDLRIHPWMGPAIFDAKAIYDPRHFMDFTQASVRGLFHSSENVLARAKSFTKNAREIWFSYHFDTPIAGQAVISRYLDAVEMAANAIASLNGHPLYERRFLLNFPARAEAVGHPGLYAGLLGLLGGYQVELDQLKGWMKLWNESLDSFNLGEVPICLHPYRRAYYTRAFDFILQGSEPRNMLWPFMRTWTTAIQNLGEDQIALQHWQTVFSQLGLLEDGFSEKLAALDAYLDQVERILEQWALEFGA